MKTKLLFTKQNYCTIFTLFVFCLCFNFGYSQTSLTLNGDMQSEPDNNDNADAWDMSPNSTLADGSASPYRALWYNSDLDSWLNTNCGDSNEAAGSSSDGNWDYSAGPTMGVITRGLKLNEACRRLYQKIVVTPGVSYTLTMESRSEAVGVPSEVYILNTEIIDEAGFPVAGTFDANFDITNDHNPSKSNATTDNFTENTFVFTPLGSFIVIYVRAPLAVDSSHEVFFDNVELYTTASLSVDDFSTSNVKVFPNPASSFISIESNAQNEISTVQVFDMLGKQVINSELQNNNLNVSALSKGIYMLKINSVKGNSISKKIIIE